MKRFIPIFIATISLFSCNGGSKKAPESTDPTRQVIENASSVDTLMEKLKQEPVPKDFVQVGETMSDTLTYTGFSMGDLGHFTFQDEQGTVYDFNDTRKSPVPLIVDAKNPNNDNGGFEANPEFVNKKFAVVWRTLKLNRQPNDEMEMYYREYNEMLYLKLLQ